MRINRINGLRVEGPESRVHYSANVRPGDGRILTGVGRQILPVPQTREDWERDGQEAQVEAYDAYAMSHTDRSQPPLDHDGPFEQRVLEDVWVIQVPGEGDIVDTLRVDTAAPEGNPLRYERLRDQIEAHVGKTGLLILVS